MLLLRVVEMRSRLSCGRGVHPAAPIGGWFSFRPGSVVRGLAFRLPARVVQLVWAHFDVSACAFFAARAKMVGGLGNTTAPALPLHRRTLHSYQLSPSPFAHALSLLCAVHRLRRAVSAPTQSDAPSVVGLAPLLEWLRALVRPVHARQVVR